MAGTRTGATAASLSLLGGRGATASQRPRRLGPSMATRLRRGGRARADLTSHGHRGGVGTGAVRSAWSLFRCFHPWGVDVASRRTLEDPVEARRHPLGVVAVLITSPPSSSLGDSSSGSPLCLDLAQRASNAWRSRFFFFSPFFTESLADFCFSADRRRASRSTSSSFTGGLEDRTSIRPC